MAVRSSAISSISATLQPFLNAPASPHPEAATNQGDYVLTRILHIAADRSGIVRSIASDSSLPAMLIARLLPVIATLAVGAISKQVMPSQ